MLHQFRRRLASKLFLTYLIVIVVQSTLLIIASNYLMPRAFAQHQVVRGVQSSSEVEEFRQFHTAVMGAVGLALLITSAAAIAISLYASRRLVAPVKEMARVSSRLAAGHYDERVALSAPDEDELGELARGFNRMATALEKTEARRRALLGDVTHELRTPLAGIKGYMEGLMDGLLPAEASTFQKVYHEADRLQRLVDDLQELSRVEGGACALRLAPHSVAEVVANVLGCLRSQFQDKGVSLVVELPAGLPPVRADADRLGQVLLNLLGNALQYTPPGGRVSVGAWRQRDKVRIEVNDTGIGIAAEYLPHVFERFFRVDRSRSRVGGGSGIGLTIAKYLVEAQGGTLEAASPGPGQGSTFSFTVPVA
jgi:signal transduction histidine kinase